MHRVLPRDAFNDANLLKCIGQLTLLIGEALLKNWQFEYDGEPFDIQQDESSGNTSISNIAFTYKEQPVAVFRPINAREPWPLYVELETGDVEPIFDYQGNVIYR